MSISATSIVLLQASANNLSLKFSINAGLFADDTSSISIAVDDVKTLSFNDGIELKQSTSTSSKSGFLKVYTDTSGNLTTINEYGNRVFAGVFLSKIPKYNFSDFSITGLQKYIDNISFCNNPTAQFYNNDGVSYVADVINAYRGGVYAPTLNRIYMIPYGEDLWALWHYIDCSIDKLEAYWATSDGQDPGSLPNPNGQQYGYWGGAYDPVMDRIYMAPSRVTSTWEYIDAATGFVDLISAFAVVDYAYRGAVYSPKQQRIYFVPYKQALQPTWHYINCATNTVVAYTHDASNLVDNAYQTGSYDPINNRIYFGPLLQAQESTWHYVDCNTGNIVGYTAPDTNTYSYPYVTFSPLQNRLYFMPYTAFGTFPIIYLDCYSDQFVTYNLTFPYSYVFSAASYSPIHNVIFLIPGDENEYPGWPYIDCQNGNVKILLGKDSTFYPVQTGAIFAPSNNKLYFISNTITNIGTASNNIYIEDLDADITVSSIFMSGALYNKS